MNTYEVAEFYNISLKTVRSMREEGLPFIESKDKPYKYEYEYNSLEEYLNIDNEIHSEYRILIKISDVIDITGFSKTYIYSLVDTNQLPCYKLRGTKGSTFYRFDEDEVDYWYKEIYLKG